MSLRYNTRLLWTDTVVDVWKTGKSSRNFEITIWHRLQNTECIRVTGIWEGTVQLFLPMVAIRRVRGGRWITRSEGSCHSPGCSQGCRLEEYNYLSTVSFTLIPVIRQGVAFLFQLLPVLGNNYEHSFPTIGFMASSRNLKFIFSFEAYTFYVHCRSVKGFPYTVYRRAAGRESNQDLSYTIADATTFWTTPHPIWATPHPDLSYTAPHPILFTGKKRELSQQYLMAESGCRTGDSL